MPGHVHLKDLGQLVAREVEAAGGVAKEFNTSAVDASFTDAEVEEIEKASCPTCGFCSGMFPPIR